MPVASEILQTIADGDLEKAFALANVYVASEMPGKKAELATIEGNYSVCKGEYMKNKISFDDYARKVAFANDALCQMLATKAETSPTLQSGYHALTCDREPQTAHFEQLFQKRRAAGEQIQFYYLYGGRYQSHESLSKRLAQERGGMRRGLALTATAKVSASSVLFDICEDLECSKLEFITRFCESFNINPNAFSDLKSKRLDFILQESSVLRGLQPTEFAHCYIEVSDWDNQLVPTLAQWFVEEFCACPMPGNSPTFLFFFGVNYRETDERTPREIEVALRNANHTVGLPELTMIQEEDLEDWIRHYSKPLGLMNNSARDALLDELLLKIRAKQQSSPRKLVPGKELLLHMDDVEMELKRVIDVKNE
ncbi:MAG TPA: hypothetical protein VK168_10895 [Saprospiraceae bacterium]|nr:hypothetical protein [Saprospiraceae bacterium]